MNLDNIGISTLKDSTAFKKIQFFSKANPTTLFSVKSDFQNSFNKVNNLYLNDIDFNNSYNYGIDRQHVYTSLSSSLPMFSTLMDQKSINNFFSYNLKSNWYFNNSMLTLNRLDYSKSSFNANYTSNTLLNLYNKILPNKFKFSKNIDFSFFVKIPNIFNVLGAENDSKQYSNNFKFILNTKHKKKSLSNLDFMLNNSFSVDPINNFSNSIFNTESNLKFKDYKSSNAQFLGSERTSRLVNNINSSLYK
jgi:hypothetical protein